VIAEFVLFLKKRILNEKNIEKKRKEYCFGKIPTIKETL
jgi:hypothetical protein